MTRIKFPITALILPACFLLGFVTPCPAGVDIESGSMDVRWDAGAETCGPAVTGSPIQVHQYNAQTFVLREKLCATWEAPFMYLLVGSKRALLIDTGDIGDPSLMPLERTVMGLLPGDAGSKIPLIVVHTHGHLDHREGDRQFENRPGVQLVLSDLAHVRRYFGFADWPNGTAQVDLGDRIIDVLPAPGHHPAHVVYYDRNTGILFSGDYLLHGRILVDDLAAYQASARRVAEFVRDRPVSYVLGGHIEKNSAGELLPWQSTYHPDEHVLQLTKADVLALPAALAKFNGFYSEDGSFVIENSIRILMVVAAIAILALMAAGIFLFRFIRRRKRGPA
jgi:glyoxylase-like metal-dependent hydrolase (beta-lactamase superfamily II)